MRKTLLFFIIILGFVAIANAQTKEWNFTSFSQGNITAESTVNGLTIYPKTSTDTGSDVAIDANNKSMDGYSFTQRLKLGGAGALQDGTLTATNRAVKFDVTGGAAITIYGMASASKLETPRVLAVTDGINELGSLESDGNAIGKTVINYSGPATSIYIYSKSSGFNIYMIKLEPKNSTSVKDKEVSKEISSVKYYDLTGKEVPAETKGFIIEKTTYEDGSTDTTKSIVR